MIVERFIEWAESAPSGLCAEAAGALARAYLHSDLPDDERDDAELALTCLLDTPSPHVRRAIAEAFGADDRAPSHIVLALCEDQDEIAAIVLEHSPVVLEAELTEYASTRRSVIQSAIARRAHVPPKLCSIIAEHGSSEACHALVSNPGAELTVFALETIVAAHGEEARMREALLGIERLPVGVRHSLMMKLGESLRDLVSERSWMERERTDRLVRDACEKTTVSFAMEASSDELPSFLDRLIDDRRLTTTLLVRALAAGHAEMFEMALARLADVPLKRVQMLISSGRRVSVEALLERAKLPQSSWPIVFAGIDALASQADAKDGSVLIEQIVGRLGAGGDGEAGDMLRLLRKLEAEAKRDAARRKLKAIRAA